MRSTFKLLFYINKQKIKANGNCPIMGRITLDGKICQYSTGEEISPVLWDADLGRAIIRGNTPKDKKGLKSINSRLEELELKARTTYKKSSDAIGYVSAEIIKNALLNRAQSKETLITLLDEHIQEYA